eukprot:s312_g2.t1
MASPAEVWGELLMQLGTHAWTRTLSRAQLGTHAPEPSRKLSSWARTLSRAPDTAGRAWTRTLSRAPDAAGHAWTRTLQHLLDFLSAGSFKDDTARPKLLDAHLRRGPSRDQCGLAEVAFSVHDIQNPNGKRKTEISRKHASAGQPFAKVVEGPYRELRKQLCTHGPEPYRELREQLCTHGPEPYREFGKQLCTHGPEPYRELREQLCTHGPEPYRELRKQLCTHGPEHYRELRSSWARMDPNPIASSRCSRARMGPNICRGECQTE